MATKLHNKVVRETHTVDQGRTLMVAILPGDVISVWQKGCHKKWDIPVLAVLHTAIKMEMAALKRERKKKKGM
jgi:hypothetical protein